MVYEAIIIGSGAAGYSTADWLYKYGIKDIAIISENRFFGTSRNTGSDKQTYYKLSLDGLNCDSAYQMAKDIANGGACDGVMAFIEAVNSPRCFYRLKEYGVDFPNDEYGGFVGYKTDHDKTKRATSIGPLTSKVMTEKLENKVLNINKTKLLDNRLVIKMLVIQNQVKGVLVLNTKTNKIEKILSKNVIVATGAPACVYSQSVYPKSQHGMTGVMIECGAELCNFSEWQYGLSSIKFRWNVSGSYMQAIPRMYSVDSNGVENEFLLDYYDNPNEAYNNLFLKGYQWPFDYNKINNSSRIDMLVQEELNKGNKVYLDYLRNPKSYQWDTLSSKTQNYLVNSKAVKGTPIERLKALNIKAINLYKNNGIDIEKEPLEIAVCAQHNNGGINVDEYYQTNINGLFVVGEAAGVFGIIRQGGTALNSTQVGGLRVAQYLSQNNKSNKKIEDNFIKVTNEYQELVDSIKIDDSINYSYVSKKMSKFAGFIRNKEEIIQLIQEIKEILGDYKARAKSIKSYFKDKDMLISALNLLECIVLTMEKCGSRGGAIYVVENKIKRENIDYRKYRGILKNNEIFFEKIRAVPCKEWWFENFMN